MEPILNLFARLGTLVDSTSLIQLGLGLMVSGVIGIVAYRQKALSVSGVVGAIITGTVIFGFGGWVWAALLVTFFVVGTTLTKFREEQKAAATEKFTKGSPQRDITQVIANGGLGVVLAIAYGLTDNPIYFFAFIGAIASVTADTAATELGVLSRQPPRLITTGEEIEHGISGGMSSVGALASLGGGLVIGLMALLYIWIGGLISDSPPVLSRPGLWVVLITAATLGGFAGSLVDTVLGATVQAIYYSPKRDTQTERSVDPDGNPNELARGRRWLTNDLVNFLASVAGAATSTLLYLAW